MVVIQMCGRVADLGVPFKENVGMEQEHIASLSSEARLCLCPVVLQPS